MDFGDLIIRWAIRLAMLLLAASLAGAIVWRDRPAWFPTGRWLWTAGCLLFLGHMAAAFHFYHHWTHAHAFADTALKTRAALGMEFGWGLYVNHLFALVWTGDVVWSWLGESSYRRRPAWVTWSVNGFLLFIAINGLAIFKDGPIRWTAISVVALLALLWLAVPASSKSQLTTSKQVSKV